VTDKVVKQRTTISDQNDEEEPHKVMKGSVSVQEAQRCMSLYFALCTKVALQNYDISNLDVAVI
jgi:hypothetical protein